MPSIKRNPKQFNTARFRLPVAKPKEMKNVWTAARIVEKLDATGRRMLRKELEELSLMQRKRKNNLRRLFKQFEGKKISAEQLETKTDIINDEIERKHNRIKSLIDKREYLIGPRIKTLAENSLFDPFYNILSHKAFSARAKVLINRKRKNTQTIVIVDVDKLKRANQIAGHIRGGTVLLAAFAETAKEISEKYKGICARYGSDEFTFHFDRPADQVQKIMEEFQQRARNKLMNGPLKGLIQQGKILGTSTCSIIQVNFGFQKQNNQGTEKIYANVMDHVSRELMALKKQNKRGTITIVKDDQIIEKK